MPRHHLGPRLRSAASLEEKSLWLNMLGKVESPPSMKGYLISLCCIQSLKVEYNTTFLRSIGIAHDRLQSLSECSLGAIIR